MELGWHCTANCVRWTVLLVSSDEEDMDDSLHIFFSLLSSTLLFVSAFLLPPRDFWFVVIIFELISLSSYLVVVGFGKRSKRMYCCITADYIKWNRSQQNIKLVKNKAYFLLFFFEQSKKQNEKKNRKEKPSQELKWSTHMSLLCSLSFLLKDLWGSFIFPCSFIRSFSQKGMMRMGVKWENGSGPMQNAFIIIIIIFIF